MHKILQQQSFSIRRNKSHKLPQKSEFTGGKAEEADMGRGKCNATLIPLEDDNSMCRHGLATIITA